MAESARVELELRVRLYEFYVGSYIKGIAFYLGITGILLKFAVDSENYRSTFCAAGILCAVAVLVPLVFGSVHERAMRVRFRELAKATDTEAISTSPLRMLVFATVVFWVIIAGGWVYIWQWP